MAAPQTLAQAPPPVIPTAPAPPVTPAEGTPPVPADQQLDPIMMGIGVRARRQQQDHQRAYAPTILNADEEAKFQDWVRQMPWFKDYVRTHGEEPDLGYNADYDYRGAWQAGAGPNPQAQNHWPSRSPSGRWLKSPDHPTAWKEYYQGSTGRDADADKVTQQQMQGAMDLADRPMPISEYLGHLTGQPVAAPGAPVELPPGQSPWIDPEMLRNGATEFLDKSLQESKQPTKKGKSKVTPEGSRVNQPGSLKDTDTISGRVEASDPYYSSSGPGNSRPMEPVSPREDEIEQEIQRIHEKLKDAPPVSAEA